MTVMIKVSDCSIRVNFTNFMLTMKKKNGWCANLLQKSLFVQSRSFLELQSTLDTILTTCFFTCGAFRVCAVKFRVCDACTTYQVWGFLCLQHKIQICDARTTHGDYRLVWGLLRLAPIICFNNLEILWFIITKNFKP